MQLSEGLAGKPRHYQKLIYSYIKQKYPGLIKIAKVFIHHTQEDFDNHVSVEGGTGSGKSAWTFLIVHVMHELQNKTFDLKKNCLFIPDEGELKHKMQSLKQYDGFWLDEAIRALDKKRWWDANQIDMNHIVKTERWKNNTVFYNIQRFNELTETFRNDNIYFRIFIIKKFASVLYVKDEDKDIDDPWHIRENISIKYRNKYGATRYQPVMLPNKRLDKERKCPNYFMDSEFPDPRAIPGVKEYWDYYVELKMKSRQDKQHKDKVKEESKSANKWDMKFKSAYAKHIRRIHAEKKMTKKKLWEEEGQPCSWGTWLDLFKIGKQPIDGYNNTTNKEFPQF